MTTAGNPEPIALVELRGVRKRFGGVHALKGVDLTVRAGSVVGLAGENGAGKSTLIKVLTGIHVPDAGEIRFNGVLHPHVTPQVARRAGIASVAQELSLFEHLSVAQNILIGQEPLRWRFVDRGATVARARGALQAVGAGLDPHTMVRDLAFADRQLVEIAKALVSEPKVLILDEPTSALRESEVDRLLTLVKRLATEGRGIVLITHRMNEFFEVCDEFTVLKDGESVAHRPASQTTPEDLVSLMVGRKLDSLFPGPIAPNEDAATGRLLMVENFGVPGTPVADISFELNHGEVLGIAGLAGNGQTQLLEGIAGIRAGAGTLTVDKHTGPFRSPRAAVNAGISLVPEDRKRHGLVLQMSVQGNMTLPTISRVSRLGVINRREDVAVARSMIDRVRLRPPVPTLEAQNLSGGNQQKVVLGKTLLAQPTVYLFADPTRGIDVGTKREIYILIRQLAAAGNGIVLVSTDLLEMINLCDRVLVMASGRVVAELPKADLTEETITKASFGREIA